MKIVEQEIEFSSTDWNYSHMRDISKSLISFPFPKQDLNCPRRANIKLSLRDGTSILIDDAVAIWRKVLRHLGRGYGGHLVVFFDENEEKSRQFLDILKVQVSIVGPILIGHELCDVPYPVS